MRRLVPRIHAFPDHALQSANARDKRRDDD
jgi:hypothetical protein